MCRRGQDKALQLTTSATHPLLRVVVDVFRQVAAISILQRNAQVVLRQEDLLRQTQQHRW